MASTKISQFTTATTIDGTELLPIVQAGVNKKIDLNQAVGLPRILAAGDFPRIQVGVGGQYNLVLPDNTTLSSTIYWDDTYLYNISGVPIAISVTNLNMTSLLNMGLVRWNGADLIDKNGIVISNALSANTVLALPLASSSFGDIYVTIDPGDNGVTGLSCDTRSNGTKWSFMGGRATIAADAPNIKITCPSSTWIGAYTIANSTGNTSITSAGGVHDLTTALVVTAGDHYITIISGTGWTPGNYKIVSIDTTTGLTILYPYGVGLGQPVIALTGTDFAVLRVKLPPLSITGNAKMRMVYDHSHVATSSTLVKAQHVAAAGITGSGYNIYAPAAQTTNAPIVSAQFGFFNYITTNAQRTMFATGDGDGWDISAAGATASGTIETNIPTDILVVFNITDANDSIKINNWDLEVML